MQPSQLCGQVSGAFLLRHGLAKGLRRLAGLVSFPGEHPFAGLSVVRSLRGANDGRFSQVADSSRDAQDAVLLQGYAGFLEPFPAHLEGWEVRESQYLKSIESKSEVKRGRADLLKGLHIRLGSPAPEPIRLAIEGTNDLERIDDWYRATFIVTSWEEFQTRMAQH